jgi:acetoacetate decarboxylase
VKGFALPLTPAGKHSVVHGPPWWFDMDCIQFDYFVEPNMAMAFLPRPLALDDTAPGAIQLAFCDSTAVSEDQPDLHVWAPGDANYLECLLKIRCRQDGRAGYYVALSWVTNDQSLVRGFLQGFPKRLARIDMTRFFRAKQCGGAFQGSQLGARVQTNDGMSLSVVHTCEHRGTEADLPSGPFLLRQHVPCVGVAAGTMIDQLVEPVVESSVISDIWVGHGRLSAYSGAAELGPLIPPNVEGNSRAFHVLQRNLGVVRVEASE